MVVAAGLSPAWQQVLAVDDLRTGEVNRTAEAYWCASGKVLNAALTLHHLNGMHNGASIVVSTLGGPAYDAIEREFDLLGARRQWIRTAAPTRVCTTIVDRQCGVVTELVENAGPITADELSEFRAAFAAAAATASAVVLTGSLPRGAPVDFFRTLVEGVRCPAVLDIRGPELLAALQALPAVVKPNRAELSATLGRPANDVGQLHAAMTELLQRGAQAVVVTAGKEPTWLATSNEFQQFTPRTAGSVVNPLGCGDCLAAGIAWALASGRSLSQA
ncbi:MAG: bifunctional hydroxymethylpyrimidine kinase/phosphomethylpyrimidine kinase, partial [Pirellulales bacterium]|nr:bifunctional hydroxymethylpyrimidine kinase/phosphomethylpyrimidine kinase [Pirellulales bacterium]